MPYTCFQMQKGYILNPRLFCPAERSRTTELVNVFYDLVTDLYEWGWGQVSNVFSGMESSPNAITLLFR